MIKIKDVRERITTINLDKCKIRLNDYLYRWITQLNLRDLSLKHVKTQIEIDLPNLESLEITLTNKSCVPCFPDNYKIRKLIIDDRTGKIEPILKLLRKFVDVECLEIRRALYICRCIQRNQKISVSGVDINALFGCVRA